MPQCDLDSPRYIKIIDFARSSFTGKMPRFVTNCVAVNRVIMIRRSWGFIFRRFPSVLQRYHHIPQQLLFVRTTSYVVGLLEPKI